MKRKISLFLIFLSLLLGGIGYFISQRNIYSKEILRFEILGPEKATLLEEVEYKVVLKNNGKFRLEEPELIFEYPSHTLVKEQRVQQIKLEDIYPGEERTISFKGRIVGKEGEIKVAKAKLIFRPKEIKSLYEANTSFSTKIEKSPLTFNFDLPSKIESGKEIQFRLNYFSNIDYPLSDLGILIEYPEGFQFLDSDPKTLDKAQFEIGILNKAEGGRVKIRGKISGNIGEEKIFKATLGIWQKGEFIPLKEAIRGVEIIEPSLYISQLINGNPQYIASPGEFLHYEVYFKNIGEEPQENLFLVIKLEGKAFDFETLRSPQGDFEPGDNSIIFDWRKIPELQYLAPQEEGKVEFWVRLKDEWGYTQEDENPVLRTKIYLSQIREEFENKINSKLVIFQKGYFQDEVFGNSGSIPPKVGEETTYTISWQIKNFYNKVKNVKVKGSLPENVELTGKIFPEDEVSNFAFDSKSREIVWNIGDLNPGILEGGPNIFFQVKLIPTEEERGKEAEIIKEVVVTGEDEWTGQEITSRDEAVNTTLPDDPTIEDEDGIVQ